MSRLTRRRFVAATASAFASIGILRFPAEAAEFTIKVGTDLAADHPTATNLNAAASAIAKATNGRAAVQVFPNNQLGNDEQMLSQVRSGAIQAMAVGDNILATLVPAAAVDNIPFAWKNPQAPFPALDGNLGAYVRGQIEKQNLFAFQKVWDEGFREMTSSVRAIHSPADLKGFKMRVPPSPISSSMIKALGGAPTTINVAELYSALQTHLVDGQENPLALIETHKFYEVQKYCSMTNHMWVGYWLIGNGDFFKKLPNDVRAAVEKGFDDAAVKQRSESIALNESLRGKLSSQGMTFNDTDSASFRAQLRSAGFYKQWQGTFGDQAWKLLEKYTGALG
jgi:tripartite ATP-independent transporter DctP family solute receptor